MAIKSAMPDVDLDSGACFFYRVIFKIEAYLHKTQYVTGLWP